MLRKLFVFSVPLALALLIAFGCGGGGSKNGTSGTSGTTGTSGTSGTVADGPGIVRDIYSKPIVGAVVTFYNAGGTSLGKTTVGRTGQAGTPPSGATGFSVSVTTILGSDGKTETYYDTYEYLYNSLNYDGTVAGCTTPLVSGAFGSSVVFTPRATGTPPGAPTGCSSATGS